MVTCRNNRKRCSCCSHYQVHGGSRGVPGGNLDPVLLARSASFLAETAGRERPDSREEFRGARAASRQVEYYCSYVTTYGTKRRLLLLLQLEKYKNTKLCVCDIFGWHTERGDILNLSSNPCYPKQDHPCVRYGQGDMAKGNQTIPTKYVQMPKISCLLRRSVRWISHLLFLHFSHNLGTVGVCKPYHSHYTFAFSLFRPRDGSK